MAGNTVFKLKRSSVAGKIPTTSDIAIGELGINLTDRKLFSSDGSNVWEIGANLTTLSVSTNATVNNVIFGTGGVYANGGFGSAGQVLTSNSTSIYWSTVTGGGGGFTNGQSISVNNFVITGAFTANSSNGSSGQVLTSNGSATYWSTVTAGGSSITFYEVTGTTQTAVKDYRYGLTNAAATTVTLPASPSAGDTLYIVICNGLTNNIVARNGSNIMGAAEDLTIDINNFSFGLVYVNATKGWWII